MRGRRTLRACSISTLDYPLISRHQISIAHRRCPSAGCRGWSYSAIMAGVGWGDSCLRYACALVELDRQSPAVYDGGTRYKESGLSSVCLLITIQRSPHRAPRVLRSLHQFPSFPFNFHRFHGTTKSSDLHPPRTTPVRTESMTKDMNYFNRQTSEPTGSESET